MLQFSGEKEKEKKEEIMGQDLVSSLVF